MSALLKHTDLKYNTEDIYGFLAVMKLLQIAGYDDNLDPAARRILMIISGFSNPKGVCFPSIKKMAKYLGVSRTAISKQIRILEKHGYLKSTPSYTDIGGQRANIYSLNIKDAVTYQKEPHVFSCYNLKIFWQNTVTFWGYMRGTSEGYTPCNANKLQTNVTSEGCTKKTKKRKNINKTFKTPYEKLLIKKAKLDQQDWEDQNKFHEETGISPDDLKALEKIKNDLKKHISQTQLTHFLIEAEKASKGMEPKPSFQNQLMHLQNKLDEIKNTKNC